jgi:acyl dehydratase
MSVPPEVEGLIGTHYRYPDYFEVGREKIREFATAARSEHPVSMDDAAAAEAGYPALVAPLTFLAVAGRRVQWEIFTNFDIPINIARVFQRDQKIFFHRPITAGDRLYFDAYLDSVIESHGTMVIEIRSEVTDSDGQPVATGVVTMLGESARQDADPEATIAAIRSMRGGK